MFITADDIYRLGANQAGVLWFQAHFPRGANTMDILRADGVPIKFLHWGYLHLSVTEEEHNLYLAKLNIKDSHNVFCCENISNCSMITDTTNAKNSQQIYNCDEIENCTNIRDSSKIKKSNIVASSSVVVDSEGIVSCTHIKNSRNVLLSNFVINSQNIVNSSLVTNSNVVIDSKNIKHSVFVRQCVDTYHCIFCDSLTQGEYQIFNHKIDAEQMDLVYSSFDSMLEDRRLHLFEPWAADDSTSEIVINHNYIKQFAPIFQDPAFVNWVKSLPFYSPQIAYKITLQPVFLQEN